VTGARGLPARLRTAWSALDPEQRVAGAAALALLACTVLPWYQKSAPANVGGRPENVSDNLSALQVFSFVEAAVLVVAGAVLALLLARAERRGFHLPGGDGTVVLGAGLWTVLLLLWRMFDKPDVEGAGATTSLQWGIFLALAAAGALASGGARMRAAHRPEPPLPVADEPPRRRPDAARHERATEVVGEPPFWRGEPPPAPPAGRGEPRPPDRLF